MSTRHPFYSSPIWRYGFFVLCAVVLTGSLVELPEKQRAGTPFPLGGVLIALLLMAQHVALSWLRQGQFQKWFSIITSICTFGYLGYAITHPFSLGQTVLVAISMVLAGVWVFCRKKPAEGREIQNS